MNAIHLPPPDRGADGSLLYDWMFIDLNSYFASVEQQTHPELRGKPVIVVPVDTDFTCAIAASYEARAFGIKTGTPVREAKFRCPGIAIRLANTGIYVDFHHRILKAIDCHIPVEHVHSIDEVSCRLTGKWRTAENARSMALGIKATIVSRVGHCLTSSIGISTNQFLAKLGSDIQKPNGLVFLHPSELPASIAHLQIRDLYGVGENMERRLNAAHLHTIEQLWAAPMRQLRGVWGGIEGERFWYALRGIEIPREETTRRSLGHSHVLSPVDRPFAMAELVARRLTLKCASRLRRLEHLARAMQLSVWVEHGPHLDFEVHFPPVCDSLTLQKMFVRLWTQLQEANRTQPLKKVGITLLGLVPVDSAQQLELFTVEKNTHNAETLSTSPVAQEKRERLTAAMDQLNTRYGRDTVTLGIMPGAGKNFTGTKIAFDRVPEVEDFEHRREETSSRKSSWEIE